MSSHRVHTYPKCPSYSIAFAPPLPGVLYFVIEIDLCHTHSCDSAPVEVLDDFGTSPLVKAITVRAREVGDMDAGPSHSRRGPFSGLLAGLYFSSLVMGVGRMHHRSFNYC